MKPDLIDRLKVNNGSVAVVVRNNNEEAGMAMDLTVINQTSFNIFRAMSQNNRLKNMRKQLEMDEDERIRSST